MRLNEETVNLFKYNYIGRQSVLAFGYVICNLSSELQFKGLWGAT